MKEKIPLESAQASGGKGKMVPKSKCPAQGGTFPRVNGFLPVDCTKIPEQIASFSFQADIEVNPGTTETTRVTARQAFVRLPKSRQQRGSHRPSKASSLTRAGDGEAVTSCRGLAVSCAVFALCSLSVLFPCLSCQVREARIIFHR